MTVRVPAGWGLLEGAFYEEITSAGDVTFPWPALPSGAKATYVLTQAPAGSNASASLSGQIVDADLPGCYVLVRRVRLIGQADDVSRDVGVLYWPASGEDVSAPTPPSRVELPAGTTNTGTVTWTHASPPDSPVYTLSVICVTDGTTVTPSGSNLSWSWAVETGKAYVATLTCTSGDFSASAAPLGVVVAEYTALSWAAPAAGTAVAGQTSATITWATPTGGQAPYTYSDPGVVYDSQAASTTESRSTSGSGAGATTVSGLVNGQVVVLQRTVTDADGETRVVQGVASIAPAAASLTAGTAPAGQALSAGTTSVTLGTWGAPSGGTGPYTYAVTEMGGSGVTITGSGLGPWTADGLTDGVTYAFLLTITDSLSAKGYSVVTVSVSPSSALGGYELVDRLMFNDGDWTAVSSTANTVSSVAWLAELKAADGVTSRAYVRNGSSDTRTMTLGATGLRLVNGGTTQSPSIQVWPAGWTALLGGSRRDAWLIKALVRGEEPSGTAGFVHICGITTANAAPTTPTTGLRLTQSGSNTALRAACYVTSFAEQVVQTVTAGGTRTWAAELQVSICDSRRHDVYTNVGASTFRDPETGQRVRCQTASASMTAPGADVTTSSAWFATTIGGRTAFTLYHDGSATSGSYIELVGLELYRMPRGSR